MKSRRGRKPNPHAKRRATTREGRRTGLDPIDRGTPQLAARKRLATGRQDLPLDPGAVLLARELLDRAQFDKLGEVGELLRRVARAWGIGTASPQGLWQALLGAATRTSVAAQPMTTPAAAEAARRRLDRVLGKLNGSRDLVLRLAEGRVLSIVIRAWERRMTAHDAVVLDRLRRDLDRLPSPRGPG